MQASPTKVNGINPDPPLGLLAICKGISQTTLSVDLNIILCKRLSNLCQ